MYIREEYRMASTITGELQDVDLVQYRDKLTPSDRVKLNLWMVGTTIAGLCLLGWILTSVNPSKAG